MQVALIEVEPVTPIVTLSAAITISGMGTLFALSDTKPEESLHFKPVSLVLYNVMFVWPQIKLNNN